MKFMTAILAFILCTYTLTATASHYVHGYTTHNGTYVSPHMSMNPGEARSSGYSYHHNVLVPNR